MIEATLRSLWAEHGPIPSSQAIRVAGHAVYREALDRYGTWVAALQEAGLPWRLVAAARGRWRRGRPPIQMWTELRDAILDGAELPRGKFPDASLVALAVRRLGGWTEALLLAGVRVEYMPRRHWSRGATALAVAQLAERGLPLDEGRLARRGFGRLLRDIWIHFGTAREALRESTWLPLPQPLLPEHFLTGPVLSPNEVLGRLRLMGGLTRQVAAVDLARNRALTECIQRFWESPEEAVALAGLSLSRLEEPVQKWPDDGAPPGILKAVLGLRELIGIGSSEELRQADEWLRGQVKARYGGFKRVLENVASGAGLTVVQAAGRAGAPIGCILKALRAGELAADPRKPQFLDQTVFEEWLSCNERLPLPTVAHLTGVHARRLRGLLLRGELPGERVAGLGQFGFSYRILRGDLDLAASFRTIERPVEPDCYSILQAGRTVHLHPCVIRRAIQQGELHAEERTHRRLRWFVVRGEQLQEWASSYKARLEFHPDENLGELLSLSQAAELSGFHPNSLGRFIAQGRFPGVKRPVPDGCGYRLLVQRSVFTEWLRQELPPEGALSVRGWSEKLGISTVTIGNAIRANKLRAIRAWFPQGVLGLRRGLVVRREEMEPWLAQLEERRAFALPPAIQEEFVKFEEASRLTGVSIDVLRRAHGQGKLPAQKISVGNRPVYLLPREAVLEFAKQYFAEVAPAEAGIPGALDVVQAADLLGCKRDLIHQAALRGQLPARRQSFKGKLFQYMFAPDDLQAWYRSRHMVSAEQMALLTGIEPDVLKPLGAAARPEELEPWWRDFLERSGLDPGPLPLIINQREAARIVGTTRATIARAIKGGSIRAVRLLDNLLINRLDLEDWARQRRRRR